MAHTSKQMVAMDIPVFINFVFSLLLNFDPIEETPKTKVAMIAQRMYAEYWNGTVL